MPQLGLLGSTTYVSVPYLYTHYSYYYIVEWVHGTIGSRPAAPSDAGPRLMDQRVGTGRPSIEMWRRNLRGLLDPSRSENPNLITSLPMILTKGYDDFCFFPLSFLAAQQKTIVGNMLSLANFYQQGSKVGHERDFMDLFTCMYSQSWRIVKSLLGG